jgi:hypothetical protein
MLHSIPSQLTAVHSRRWNIHLQNTAVMPYTFLLSNQESDMQMLHGIKKAWIELDWWVVRTNRVVPGSFWQSDQQHLLTVKLFSQRSAMSNHCMEQHTERKTKRWPREWRPFGTSRVCFTSTNHRTKWLTHCTALYFNGWKLRSHANNT